MVIKMTKRDKTTVDDIIGIVHTDETTNSVEEVKKLRGRTNERFIVDDTGTLIDMETRNTYDYVSEVLPLLNDLTNEIKIARTVLDMNRGMIKELQNENYQLKKLFLEMLRQTDVELNPKKPTKYSATLIFDMEQYLTVRDIVKGIKWLKNDLH